LGRTRRSLRRSAVGVETNTDRKNKGAGVGAVAFPDFRTLVVQEEDDQSNYNNDEQNLLENTRALYSLIDQMEKKEADKDEAQ
jgi:hypothetical protein